MKTWITLVLLVVSSICYAQQAKKIENPRWKQVVYVKFHEGKYERALTIITDYFEKAAKKSNTSTPETVLRMNSGRWDMMIVWSMKGGVEDLNWQVNPEEVAWLKAMAEIAGGADKAKLILDEYASLIKDSQSDIGRIAF